MKYLSRINKRSFQLGLSIIMIGGVQSCSFDNHNIEKQQPNILFIMSDDHTSQAFGIYRSRLARLDPTPVLDEIANDGIIFDNEIGRAHV